MCQFSIGVDTLDKVGNRTMHSKVSGAWTYDKNNRITQRGAGTCGSAGVTCYDWDATGNLIKKTEGTRITQYAYDALNRLTEIKDGASNLIARYGYDPLNRRIWKEQYRDRAGAALAQAKRIYYLYADEGLIAESEQDITLNADNSVTATSSPSISTQYGLKPGAPFMTGVLFVKTKNSNGTQSFAYYHHDHLQTPIQATDKLGNIVWSASYEAFGRATITTPKATATRPTISSKPRFPGQIEDEETGLHYNWNRYYDPELGRYVTSDPIGLVGGINTYAYLTGNPISFIDPTGLVKHTTGREIDCGKGCWIRIDFTFDEKTGTKTRHLHWGCKGKEGECGEFGEPSHGGVWDDAPESIKQCARKYGFQGDPAPTPKPTPSTPIPNPFIQNPDGDQNPPKPSQGWLPLIVPILIYILS